MSGGHSFSADRSGSGDLAHTFKTVLSEEKTKDFSYGNYVSCLRYIQFVPTKDNHTGKRSFPIKVFVQLFSKSWEFSVLSEE